MFAATSPLPQREERWAWEPKWDGWRAVIRASEGRIAILTRAGHDVTASFPELQPLGAIIGYRNAILDGELVATDDQDRPDFGRLSLRLGELSRGAASRAAAEAPATWVGFDVCYLDGESLMDRPYRERRATLEGLELHGPAWQTTIASQGEGLAMVRACRQLGLEGVVAKRLDSRYLPNRRSRSWVKVKQYRRAIRSVIGWVPWSDARCGALAIARPEGGFAGIVEFGFSESDRIDLGQRLVALQHPTALPWRQHRGQPVYPVPPGLRVELQYLECSEHGQARQVSYKQVAT
jgi:bifunctional non-homologous end joining protein LigD